MSKSPEAFRTISEVAGLLDVPAHVLRFWETRFSQIRPVKRVGGRRYYRPTDIALLSALRVLLHDQGLAIRAVQKMLRDLGVREVCKLADPNLTLDAEIEWEEEARRPVTIIRHNSAEPISQSAEVVPLRIQRGEHTVDVAHSLDSESSAAVAVMGRPVALSRPSFAALSEDHVNGDRILLNKEDDMPETTAAVQPCSASPTPDVWLSAALNHKGDNSFSNMRALALRAKLYGAAGHDLSKIASLANDLRALRELISQGPGK